MKGNLHVRFLEEGEGAIPSSYSAIARARRAKLILASWCKSSMRKG
jgi:hypothetical protein